MLYQLHVLYSIVSFTHFQPTKPHLEGNYYADKLFMSNCLRIAVIWTLLRITKCWPIVFDPVKYLS